MNQNNYNDSNANTNDKWSVYHVNVNNLDSKYVSMKSILVENPYSVVTLNETHCKAGRKVSLPGYLTYSRNRVNNNSGGISTSVLLNDAPHSVKVDEGRDENEFVITRHSQFEVPVNVLNMYGQQECRMKKEKIEEQWKEILEVISSIEQRKEFLL